MKQVLALILALCFLCASASAHPWATFSVKYNSCAIYFGAAQLNGEEAQHLSVFGENDTLFFSFGSYELYFAFNEKDEPVSAYARLLDESASLDYLLSCVAIVSTFGGIDFQSIGILLNQFTQARQGKETKAQVIGLDIFQISQGSDGALLVFNYVDQDNQYGN